MSYKDKCRVIGFAYYRYCHWVCYKIIFVIVLYITLGKLGISQAVMITIEKEPWSNNDGMTRALEL